MVSVKTTDRLEGFVALYGGSFDPPHMGHQIACLYLLEALGADAVWLVPVGRHAFDKPLTPGHIRLQLAGALASPFGTRVRVESMEVDRDEVSRTHRTLQRLKEAYPDKRFVLVIGEDLVAGLPKWENAERLFAETPVVILGREGGAPTGRGDHAPKAQSGPLLQVSSTDIRQRVAEGRSVRGLVPLAVGKGIEAHRLYRSSMAK